jgi:hypothetical protein
MAKLYPFNSAILAEQHRGIYPDSCRILAVASLYTRYGFEAAIMKLVKIIILCTSTLQSRYAYATMHAMFVKFVFWMHHHHHVFHSLTGYGFGGKSSLEGNLPCKE